MSYISDNSHSYDLTDLINSLVCGNAIQMDLGSIFSIVGRYTKLLVAKIKNDEWEDLTVLETGVAALALSSCSFYLL